jgi:hypothetical protein
MNATQANVAQVNVTQVKAQELAARYVAVWNESDAQARKQRIAELWAEDGTHYSPSMEAHGYAALERRVIGSWEKWVAGAGHSFRACSDVASHHGGVKFHWEMISPSGDVASLGFEFLVLGPDGRIATDYMFVLR